MADEVNLDSFRASFSFQNDLLFETHFFKYWPFLASFFGFFFLFLGTFKITFHIFYNGKL